MFVFHFYRVYEQLFAPGKRVHDSLPEGIKPHISTVEEYERVSKEALDRPEVFWSRTARELLHWQRDFTETLSGTLEEGNIEWFRDGLLNVAENCVHRHARDHPDRVALVWEGDEVGTQRKITYSQLKLEVDKIAAYLHSLPELSQPQPLTKVPVVSIYMPMVPETAFVMLACAQLGLMHNVVFAGFSAEALHDRLVDAQSPILFTADFAHRGGKRIHLLKIAKDAINMKKHIEGDAQISVKRVVVLERNETIADAIPSDELERYYSWKQVVQEKTYEAPPVASVPAEHPLFLLYTSGSTGKPKGLLHTSGGYLAYAAFTSRLSFDLHPEAGDVFGCLADVGWITGHTYIVYGPLALGATTVMFESLPTFPDPSRYWELVDRLGITQLYTAPTVIRALRRFGDEPVKPFSLETLRILGSVGEPINADAWLWYRQVVGRDECSVVDTFWQTETGGHVIAPLPAVHKCKPGAAGFPYIGIDARLLDPVSGEEIVGAGEGVLVIRRPWPGMARSVYGDHTRYLNTYFRTYPGHYFTGDAAHRDADGHIWIRGRVDDVINVSGHRLSTAEIEAALGRHPRCAEAAVLGKADDITGQSIWAFCILKGDTAADSLVLPEIKQEMIQFVRQAIGPIATPSAVILTTDLPKTRSGKIMRRLLRKILAGEADQLGDLSTLNNPAVIDEVIKLVQEEEEDQARRRK